MMTIRLPIAAALLAVNVAHAQDYPSRTITLIVSSPPGAGTDLVARTVADRLAPRLGTIVVDNRGGAAGLIGGEAVKKAGPDGHTLLFTNDSLVLQRALGQNPGFNVLTDFVPVVLAATVDFFLVASGDALAATTPQELVRLAKQKPGTLSYASPGSGAAHHLAMELFKQQTGADFLHVPYKGMGPAMPDVVAGRVQLVMSGFPAIAGHMKTGKLRILASAGPARSPLQPDLPTLKEAGIPNVEMEGYFYLVAPLSMPQAIVSRLNAEVNQVLAQPHVKAELLNRAVTAAGGTPQQLQEKLRSEVEKWTRVVRTAGIKPE
jgi:tripartite-type tricarboxylate transporter receptor subunit TctC